MDESPWLAAIRVRSLSVAIESGAPGGRFASITVASSCA